MSVSNHDALFMDEAARYSSDAAIKARASALGECVTQVVDPVLKMSVVERGLNIHKALRFREIVSIQRRACLFG